MANIYPPEGSPNLKARELLEAVLQAERQYFIMPFHAPELGIKPNEYYVVEVRRVQVPAIDQTLDMALPLPEYEVVSGQ